MKLLEFISQYPDEESCIKKLKEIKDAQAQVCPKCGCQSHYWKSDKLCYECKHCHHRIGIRYGTVMENSKLPFRYWFIAIHLLTATKQSFSAMELQRQLGHKRYQPIWEMLHKLRNVMGKRDSKYSLSDEMEVDEGFFSTECPEEEKGKPLKAGAGSQKKSKVLVMAESQTIDSPKNIKKPKRVKHLKMCVIEDLKASTIDKKMKESVDAKASLVTDDSKSHTHFKDNFKEHKSQVVSPKDICKILPWVHIAISNAKSVFTNIYHGIKKEFLQEYLNEFCYKFNRRYFGEHLFDRLLMISANYNTDFKHRIYNSNLSTENR